MAEVPGDDVLPVMERIGKLTTVLNSKSKYSLKSPTSLEVASETHKPVIAKIDYGMVSRGESSYNLTYFAKSVERPVEASTIIGKGFELTANLVGDYWEVRAFTDGKPEKVATVFVGPEGTEIYADDTGKALVPVSESGAAVPVRATRSIEKSGSIGGQNYTLTKQWTTLVLPAVSKISADSDPVAYRALQLAGETRESLIPGGKGFVVDFEATDTRDKVKGTVTWDGQTGFTIGFNGMEENSYTKHVRSQLMSLFVHRLYREFDKGEGKYAITLAPSTKDHIALKLADPSKSSYKIQDNKMVEVVRTFNGQELTLKIDKFQTTPNGRYLSTHFTSVAKDVETGKVKADLVYKDSFTQAEGIWLPANREITGTNSGRKLTMKVKFGKYKFND